MDSLASYLDLANHHANATAEDIKKLCADVVAYSLHAAFVNPCYIALAKETLTQGRFPELKRSQFRESTGSDPKVGTAISFPLGQETVNNKQGAANEAVQLGADELDVVPNLGLFLAGNTQKFLSEMTAIVESARMVGKSFDRAQDKPVIVKFIIETGYLTDDQMGDAAKLVVQSGADFVKLCSGMGPRGASTHDVEVVRKAVGPNVKIKVAGGIDTKAEAEAMIAAGANRIGTSHAVAIVTQNSTASPSIAGE